MTIFIAAFGEIINLHYMLLDKLTVTFSLKTWPFLHTLSGKEMECERIYPEFLVNGWYYHSIKHF